MDVNRERLNREMEDRRYALGMRTWRALSERAGIAYETLRALRAGSNPSGATVRDLETALQWEHGSIDAVLAGGDPTPIESETDSTDDDLSVSEKFDKVWAELEYLTEEVKRLRERDRRVSEPTPGDRDLDTG
jgi:hypothetical protein